MDLGDGKRMFGDLKSKLGFGSKNQEPAYDDYYDEAYDDYADDYDDGYAGGYDDYADDGYDDYAPRSERGASSRAAADPYRVTARPRATTPRLVSMEDVRANARANASYDREPLSSRQGAGSGRTMGAYDNGRTMVDSSLPPQMTPEGTAAEAAAATRRRSEGLDSLFAPTDAQPEQPSFTPAPVRPASDSYDSYSKPALAGYGAARNLKVIKPMSYADVEGVARALKAGDVVVLALGNTPEALSKRILDFSFGVASALDASVDALAVKVFAITKGSELSEVERINLRNQGVL